MPAFVVSFSGLLGHEMNDFNAKNLTYNMILAVANCSPYDKGEQVLT